MKLQLIRIVLPAYFCLNPICVRIIESISELNRELNSIRAAGKSIGFVPTMGALHEGHMALIQRAKQESDCVIATVFINPTQFNNPSDLELYPRTPKRDIALLELNGCDIAFFPSSAEMYPKGLITPEVPLGRLEELMEGAFRPGHFKGVIQIVYRFFDLIAPNKAFFGLKDLQQVAVIQFMVQHLQLAVEIVPCATLRESNGLAMSSRNERLSEDQRVEALHIFQTMQLAQELAEISSPREVLVQLNSFFVQSNLKLEYMNLVDPKTLEELDSEWVPHARICIAAYCGDVRLIDNMEVV